MLLHDLAEHENAYVFTEVLYYNFARVQPVDASFLQLC